MRLSILGASWFWLVGAVSLSQLPSFAKMTLGADSSVVSLFLAAFSIGVGVGSSLCGRLMHGEVSARYVPLAALGMARLLVRPRRWPARRVAAGADGVDRHRRFPVATRRAAHLRRPPGIAVSGGFFVVPLYAIIQNRSDEASRARIIAANNVINALFMAGAAAVTAGLIAVGLDTPDAVPDPRRRQRPGDGVDLQAAAAAMSCGCWRASLFRLAYRVEVRGPRERRGCRRAGRSSCPTTCPFSTRR